MMVKNAENRSQMEFVSLEEMVPQNHLLRKIDAAIDFNKLYEFVEKLYCEDNGRPSIDPVVLFKIVLIQHIYGISSLRRTLEEVSMNLAYRWFIGYPLNEAVPHFSTVSYNFKHRFNHATVEYVFRWVLKAAAEEGYLDTEAIFVDGTHIKASANLKKQAKKAVPKEAKRYARELFEEVNKDREEHGKKPFSDDSDKKPPEEKETVVSTTDPESGVFHKGEHKKCFAYEAHTACDKHNFILGVHITPGNVHDSVAFDPLYDELCEYYPEHQTVVADSAYKTPWICKRIFESGRTLATCYTRPKTKENGHPWWTYVYDEYFDDVICPEYRALHYTTTNRDGYREYKSRTYFCKNCPTRAQCTENAKCEKTVLRHVWQDFVEMAEHVRHMTVYRELYRLRKEKIERVFADAKEKHGMRYTQYRGLAQVTNWVKLKFAAMNLKKLATWKWNDSHPGPDGGKRRRLSDVYSRFLQFFCFQLKSPLWSVYQNGLFLQPEIVITACSYDDLFLDFRELQQLLSISAQNRGFFFFGKRQRTDALHTLRLVAPGAVRTEQEAVGAKGVGHAQELFLAEHRQIFGLIIAVIQGMEGAQRVGGVQIDRSIRQKSLRLVPVTPATHVGQNQSQRANFLDRVLDHGGSDPHPAGEAYVQAGVGEHNEAQLSGPVQNTQCADVVKIHVLVDGVELDALQTQLLYPGQLGAVVVVIRMDTAEGEDPGLRKLFIDACGAVIDVQHLLRAGGHRKDHRIIYPGFGHGSHQTAVGAVHIGFCVGHLLQLGNSGGGQLVRERMGVDINDHNINSFFAGKPPYDFKSAAKSRPYDILHRIPHGSDFEHGVSCPRNGVFDPNFKRK